MTEQATLTPEEQAIMAVAEQTQPCPHCDGSGGNATETAVCEPCNGAGEVPRFDTLRVECNSILCSHVPGVFDGRRWNPVAWTDEYKIRRALEAAGFPVRYLDGQWNVSHPGTDRFPRDGCAELAVAADRAITAEAGE